MDFRYYFRKKFISINIYSQ